MFFLALTIQNSLLAPVMEKIEGIVLALISLVGGLEKKHGKVVAILSNCMSVSEELCKKW